MVLSDGHCLAPPPPTPTSPQVMNIEMVITAGHVNAESFQNHFGVSVVPPQVMNIEMVITAGHVNAESFWW